jgi:hypothetical protein
VTSEECVENNLKFHKKKKDKDLLSPGRKGVDPMRWSGSGIFSKQITPKRTA